MDSLANEIGNDINRIVNEKGEAYLRREDYYGEQLIKSDENCLDLLIGDVLKHAVYRDKYKLKMNKNRNTKSNKNGKAKQKQSVLDENVLSIHKIIKKNETMKFVRNIFGVDLQYKPSSDGKAPIKDLGMIFAFDLFLYNVTRFPVELNHIAFSRCLKSWYVAFILFYFIFFVCLRCI